MDMTDTRIPVTGGAGFTGSHLRVPVALTASVGRGSATDRCTVFTVGSGVRVSVAEPWAAISDLLGVLVDARYGPARPGDVMDAVMGATKGESP